MPETTQLPSAVPPPSSDVTVRTLESDLAAIKASGGTMLTPTGTPSGVSFVQAHPVQAGAASHTLSSLLGWLAVLIGIVAIGAAGWYGYGYLTTKGVFNTTTPTTTSTVTTTPKSTSTMLGSLPTTVGTHRSLLTKQVGHTETFSIIPPAGVLKTRYQLIRDGLAQIPATVRLTEIVPTDAKGDALSFPGYATAVGAEDLMTGEAFSTFLKNDFTLVAMRGQGGFSYAYVLSLRDDTTWIYAEPSVRQIESSTQLANLFLQLPGLTVGSFGDDTIQGAAARSAQYENPSGTLTYGWFKNRLIIATSRQVLDQVLLLSCFDPNSC